MHHIYDLNFEKEILHLFDYVGNDHSRQVLIRLLTELPCTLEEVLFRQDVLKEFLRQERIDRALYYRSEFGTVYSYMKEFGERGVWWRNRQREKGQLSNAILFLHKIHLAYFKEVRSANFPLAFAQVIENIQQFLTDIEVEKYYSIVRGRGLYFQDMGRLTRLLSEKCRKGETDRFWQDFFLFEAFFSIARGIHKHSFAFPVFTEGSGIDIQDFYHPVLKAPVRNSIRTNERLVLITGPNMSGKSTLLKSVGLCMLLAHLGLAVPAASCESGYFDMLSIALHLRDDIEGGYSHFMMELQNLKRVLVAAREGKKCFAIFDELFRGTNMEDALVIAEATLSGLARFPQGCFFVSTHLHQLREPLARAGAPAGLYHLECRLEGQRPVFVYALQRGWSDLKIGQLLFIQEGLPELLERQPG